MLGKIHNFSVSENFKVMESMEWKVLSAISEEAEGERVRLL
jgi:hypothetical protein